MNEAIEQQPRIGITVGRAFGKATVRNRIKRRVRAAVAQSLEQLQRPVDVVINPKKAVLEIEFQHLCSELQRAFRVIEEKAIPASDTEAVNSKTMKMEKPRKKNPRLRASPSQDLTARKT